MCVSFNIICVNNPMTILTFVLQVGILTDNQIRNNLLKQESRDKRLVMFKNEVCIKTMVKLAVVKLAAAARYCAISYVMNNLKLNSAKVLWVSCSVFNNWRFAIHSSTPLKLKMLCSNSLSVTCNIQMVIFILVENVCYYKNCSGVAALSRSNPV